MIRETEIGEPRGESLGGEVLVSVLDIARESSAADAELESEERVSCRTHPWRGSS